MELVNRMSENVDEDECPELVPIDILNNAKEGVSGKSEQRVPVTIVTGFLGIHMTYLQICAYIIININIAA